MNTKETEFLSAAFFEPRSRLERFLSSGATQPTLNHKSAVFRFEHGQLLRADAIIREMLQQSLTNTAQEAIRNLRRSFRTKALSVIARLNDLEHQYYENVRRVTVNDPALGHFELPVADITPKGAERAVPTFFIGGIGADHLQTRALSLHLALEGNRLIIPTMPERESAKRPTDWGDRLKREPTFTHHAALMKSLVKALGLAEVDVVGVSMGAGIALEMARDEEFEAIRNLTVIEPLGIQEKNAVQLCVDFLLRQGLPAFVDAEARMKTILGGEVQAPGFGRGLVWPQVEILRRRQFDWKSLSEVRTRGRYQVWLGHESPLVPRYAVGMFLNADIAREGKVNPPVELYCVQGGDHGWPFTHAAGFTARRGEKPADKVTHLRLTDLENSAAARIVKGSKLS